MEPPPTFTRPPLTAYGPSGYYTLPALYDFHYTHSPGHPLFVFPDPQIEGGRRVITWREGLHAAQRATEYAAASLRGSPSSTSESKTPKPTNQPVFAVLSAGDTLPYFIFILGVLRISTNYFGPPPAVFPISPKLTADVVAQLLLKTNATHLVLSGDEETQTLGRAAIDIIRATDSDTQAQKNINIEILAMPSFAQLFPSPSSSSNGSDADFALKTCLPIPIYFLTSEETQAYLDSPSLILHSTGTTGTPKPIPWTARHLAQGVRVPASPISIDGDEDLVGKIIGCQAVPMFAAMGSINLFAAPTRGAALAFFAPSSPSAAAPAPNPVILMKAAVESGCDFLLCVPAFLEIWARDPDTVKVMKRMRGFLWGGGPLAKEAGDTLIAHGIRLFLTYGSTEAGLLCRYVSQIPGSDWEYFAFSPRRDIRFFPVVDEEASHGQVVYEAAVVASEGDEMEYDPVVSNMDIDGKRAYKLPDLFCPHPVQKTTSSESKVQLWKILGRGDDTLVLSTGHKVHPTPLEGTIVGIPGVHAALMFGAGKPFCGVLIEPELDAIGVDVDKGGLGDTVAANPTAFLDKLYQALLHRFSKIKDLPKQAHIQRSMLLLADPRSKPFTYTPKGAVRRGAVLIDYKEEIERAYESVEGEGDRLEADKKILMDLEPKVWVGDQGAGEVRAFVRAVVLHIVSSRVDGPSHVKGTPADVDEKDIFATLGVTSADATWIRGTLVRALRRSFGPSAFVTQLPQTVVYANPTVVKLATWLTGYVDKNTGGKSENETDELEAVMEAEKNVLDVLEKFVERFKSDMAQAQTQASSASPALHNNYLDTVLLTGASGSLGSVILGQLLSTPATRRVYVFARRRLPTLTSSLETVALERLASALQRAGYDSQPLYDAVSTERVVLVLGDLSKQNLGLDEVGEGRSLLEKIKEEVSVIIHAAWTVNFKQTLSSFEPDLAGLCHLAALASSSSLRREEVKTKLVFISSVSVGASTPEHEIPETLLPSVRGSLGSGYGESKWVAENLLARIASSGVDVDILRLGQLAGAKKTGAWSRSEWLPSLVLGSAAMRKDTRCLPYLDGKVGWIDADTAAEAILQAAASSTSLTGARILHVTHPNPTPWNTLMQAFATHLSSRSQTHIPIVPYSEWIAQLELEADESETEAFTGSGGRNLEASPALRLLDFYRDRGRVHASTSAQHDDELEPIGMPRLALTACSLSSIPVLKTLKDSGEQLGEEDTDRWVHYWMDDKVAIE